MSRKRGGFALILLGVVVAFGVAALVFNQAQRAAETARMESVDVLVAAQDIPERSLMVAPFLSAKRMLTATPVGGPDIEVGTTQTTMQNLKVLAIGSVQPAQAAPVADKPAPAADGKTAKETNDRPAPTVGLITFAVERQDALFLK